MTEFKLDKITSFIKHKTKDCQEPALSTESNAELVCSSCPKGFMTAVGLLKHAQTNHNLKLFFERTSDVTGIQDVTVTHEDMVTSPDTNHHSSVDSLLASQGLLDSLAVKDMYDSSSSQMEQKATNSSGLYLKNHSQHYMSQPNVCHSGLQYTGSCFKGSRAAQSVGTQISSNSSASQSLGQSTLVSNSLYNSSPMQGSCTTQSLIDSIDIQTSGISSPELHQTSGISSPELHQTSGTTHFVSQSLYSEPHNSGQSVYPSHVSSSAFQKSGNISQTFSPSTFSMSNSLDSAPVQSSYQVPNVNNSGTMPVYVSCHAPVFNATQSSESTQFVSQSVLTNTIQPSQTVAQHSIPSTCTSNPSSDIWSQISSGQSISSALLDLIMKSGVILPVVNKTSEDVQSFTAYPSIPQDSGPNTLQSLFHDNPTEDKYNRGNKHSDENQDGRTKNMLNVLVQAKPSVTPKQQGSLPSVKLLLEAARRARLNSQSTAKSIGKRSLDVTTSEIACTNTDENRTSLYTSVTSVPCSHVPLNTYFNDNMKGQNNLLVTSADDPNIEGDSSNTFNYLPDSLYHNDPLHHVNLGKATMTKDSGHKTNAPTVTSTNKNPPADPQKTELSRRAESEDKCNQSFDQNVTKFHSVKLIDKPLSDNAHQTIAGQVSPVSHPVTTAKTMVSSSTSSPSDNPCTSSPQISSDAISSEAKNGSESSPSNENSEDDSVTIGCCDSKNCGVTVIPGTHEGLKKCCNAVVPKKRKRHFETKHTMSYRQKLKRRISGSESGRLHKNVDKKNSGTIFIDLEPNEDGSLSEKSSSNNNGVFASSPPSSFGFQVSGLSRSMANSQSNPKGTVILQPGAIFSIPIAYSLSTQSDGSIQPLVISQHAFQSKSSLDQDRTTTVAKSSDTSGNTNPSKPESSSNAEGPWNTSSQGPESHLLKDEDDSSMHLRRRRYPTSRPFKCEKCDSAFNQRIHLKKHMSKHTGVKPFKCNQCNYSTVERSHLKVHIRIHTGEKPFKCTYCEYATAQNSTLKIHLKRHHKPSE